MEGVGWCGPKILITKLVFQKLKIKNIVKNILIEVGKELALSTNTVIRKLNFQKVKFPLVLT